ncbi:hypothetical protein NL676_002881 [Syzygium grande]|nr:hypothetical protein NL676_002880 [Syzygium grande]KAI6674975.1 hypothetical protein NL676_002881 [Syzygium grande]
MSMKQSIVSSSSSSGVIAVDSPRSTVFTISSSITPISNCEARQAHRNANTMRQWSHPRSLCRFCVVVFSFFVSPSEIPLGEKPRETSSFSLEAQDDLWANSPSLVMPREARVVAPV